MFERFIGILLEHYAGDLPLWLAPEQAAVLPVADRHSDAAASLADQMRMAGIRTTVDTRPESVGRKIRDAELRKVKYMLVFGDKEAESGELQVRHRGSGDEGQMTVLRLIERMGEEIEARTA